MLNAESEAVTAIPVRMARPDEASALADLGARLFREAGGDTDPADLDAYVAATFSPERQAREIADPTAAMLVAVPDGRIAGYAFLVAGEGVADLLRLYVDAAWHGRGVGPALLEAAIEAWAARGLPRLRLTVWERNPRAIAFYRRHGFVETGTTTFMVGTDAQTDLVMEQRM